MSDMAATGNGDGGGDQGQQQGPDLAGITSQLESLTSGQEELRQFMQQFGQQPEPEPEQDPYQGFDPSVLAGYEDAEQGPDVNAIAQQLGPQFQQMLAPIQQQLQDLILERDAMNIASEFPELAQEDVANETVKLAHQLAEGLGRPELANEPKFWRLAYMAGRAAEAANSEGRDAPQAAHLEGGGGAAPAGSQVNPADLFGQSPRRGGSVLPF